MSKPRRQPPPQPWAALPVSTRVYGVPPPKGPCVLQGVGPGGAWVTLSKHRTGVAAMDERDRVRVWPNRVVEIGPSPAAEADVLAPGAIEGRGR